MTDHTPIFRSRRAKLPVLILDFAMQRAALIADRDAATRRRDMRAVHRIQAELRRATSKALGKAVQRG